MYVHKCQKSNVKKLTSGIFSDKLSMTKFLAQIIKPESGLALPLLGFLILVPPIKIDLCLPELLGSSSKKYDRLFMGKQSLVDKASH